MELLNILGLTISGFGTLTLAFFAIKWNGEDKNLPSPDNPLLLTIQAMEDELAELKENNIHMERIAQLEKQIAEANKQAEALRKTSNNFGTTMEEVGDKLKGSEFVVGGIKSKGLIVDKVSTYGGEISKMVREHQEENRKIIEQLDSDIKNAIQEAFHDIKPDWDGYTNSLLDKDYNLRTKDSIYQGNQKDIEGLLEHVEEELHFTGDICLRFGSRTRFFSIMNLLSNLSLSEFESKVFWDKSYDLLLANKEPYGIGRKLFEQEVFNFEEFRQAVITYFVKKKERPQTYGELMQYLYFNEERDKTVQEIKEQLREADKSVHKAEYGNWNTIPKTLNKEERLLKTYAKLDAHTTEQLEQLNIWQKEEFANENS